MSMVLKDNERQDNQRMLGISHVKQTSYLCCSLCSGVVYCQSGCDAMRIVHGDRPFSVQIAYGSV